MAPNRLVTTTCDSVVVVQISPLQLIHRFPARRPPKECIYLESKKAVLVVSPGETAKLHAIASGEPLCEYMAVPWDIVGREPFELSADGTRLIGHFRAGHSARVWDADTGVVLQTLHSDVLAPEPLVVERKN